MVDFANILKASIEKQGATATPESRAKIYNRAREAVRARIQTLAPAQVEAYTHELETAIGEVEVFYRASDEAPLQITQPLPSKADSPLDTLSTPPVSVEQSETHNASPAITAHEGANAHAVIAAEMSEPTDRLWRSSYRLSQPHSYQLEWLEASTCSICRKWAVCIDSAHCWNRN